jgi:GR25 family glycosyltransferase involved in LPS biosynthesis
MNTLFEHTIYINLEHRKDRLAHVQQELAKLGVLNGGARFNAVKTANGAIGCTISHIKCLEQAKSQNLPHIFICEDDICFKDPKVLLQNTARFNTVFDDAWDVLIIGGNNLPPYKQFGNFCAQISNCQTTTGYIVKQHYYDTIIANFREGLAQLMANPENKREFAIDIYWKRLQGADRWYIVLPLTVHQLEGYSDIEDRDTNYRDLMLDMDKTWLTSPAKVPAKPSMQFS